MRKLFFLFAIAGLLCLSGCGDNDDPENPLAGIVELPAGSESVSLSGTESKSIEFTASSDWTVNIGTVTRTEPSWIEVSPMSGKAGKASITVSMKESNNTGVSRQAIIAIKAGEGTPVKITVTQESEARLSKMITSIKTTYKDEEDKDGNNTALLSYDPSGDGRLVTYGNFKIDYTSPGLNVTANYESEMHGTRMIYNLAYTITDSRTTALSGSITEQYPGGEHTDNIKRSFSYQENKINKVASTEPAVDELIFTWDNGSISKMDIPGAEEFPIDFTYGTELNNMNLNLFPVIYFLLIDDFEFNDLVDLRGERSKYLPSKVGTELDITYTRDTQGYITKIIVGNGDIELIINYE